MDNKQDPINQAHSDTHTCWQMLAYLARTLAFSAIARAEGQLSEILSTQRHLTKSQPSFLYWAQRSDRPSNPEWNGSSKNEGEPLMSHGRFYRCPCYVSGFGNILVTLLSMQGQRALRFHQKYLNLCSEDEWRSYGFGTTWGWVINDRIFIFGRTTL